MCDFGDRVRIKATDETRGLGLAGQEGQVHGLTSPSATAVKVIGSASTDHAVNVYIEGVDEELWFDPDLLDFIDHGAGTVISLDGSDVEFVRLPNGEWEERPRST